WAGCDGRALCRPLAESRSAEDALCGCREFRCGMVRNHRFLPGQSLFCLSQTRCALAAPGAEVPGAVSADRMRARVDSFRLDRSVPVPLRHRVSAGNGRADHPQLSRQQPVGILVSMKFAKFLAASVAFVALSCLIYWIHIRFVQVNVVFYSAILDGV